MNRFSSSKSVVSTCLLLLLLTGCVSSPQPLYRALYGTAPDLSAADIVARAHEAAGGKTWSQPKTLSMNGYAVFYSGTNAVVNDSHRMWRVYDPGKSEAHQADGKVRIRSSRDEDVVLDLSFDGATTYTDQGPQPPSESDRRWSSNFGFGVIRHALDEGYSLERLADDLVDGKAVFSVRVTDVVGRYTLFAIDRENFAIVKVAFDTPRGWHERIYSDFYSNPKQSWQQPGRVRLYYDGVKANEVIWTSFVVDEELPDCLFVLPHAEDCELPGILPVANSSSPELL